MSTTEHIHYTVVYVLYILTHNTELEGLDYGGWVAVVGDALVLPAVTKDDKIINSFVALYSTRVPVPVCSKSKLVI